MPTGAISITRPGKWGNPVKLVNGSIYINASYRRKLIDPWVYYNQGNIDDVLHLYSLIVLGTQFVDRDLQYWSDKFKENDLNELIGHDLACFCSPSQKCHADVLIEICKSKIVDQ